MKRSMVLVGAVHRVRGTVGVAVRIAGALGAAILLLAVGLSCRPDPEQTDPAVTRQKKWTEGIDEVNLNEGVSLALCGRSSCADADQASLAACVSSSIEKSYDPGQFYEEVFSKKTYEEFRQFVRDERARSACDGSTGHSLEWEETDYYLLDGWVARSLGFDCWRTPTSSISACHAIPRVKCVASFIAAHYSAREVNEDLAKRAGAADYGDYVLTRFRHEAEISGCLSY